MPCVKTNILRQRPPAGSWPRPQEKLTLVKNLALEAASRNVAATSRKIDIGKKSCSNLDTALSINSHISSKYALLLSKSSYNWRSGKSISGRTELLDESRSKFGSSKKSIRPDDIVKLESSSDEEKSWAVAAIFQKFSKNSVLTKSIHIIIFNYFMKILTKIC